MATEAKEQAVAALKELVARRPSIILNDYRGLTVGQISDLRRRVIAAGGEYHVVKNRLFARALAESPAAEVTALLTGPTAVAFCGDDSPSVAKALVEFGREFEPLCVIKGGFVDGTFLDGEACKVLAAIPPRPMLLGELVGSLEYPVSALAQALELIVAELSLVLDALVEKRSAEAA